ncbi:hypothetical protein JW823_06385 [bacterium]|nr:hypothetical protein [candidate division CSSED10-310 bacterium]
MKVIVSHDIDHLTAWEHMADGMLAKFIARSTMHAVLHKICLREYIARFGEILKNRWENIDDLMEYDKDQGIPSTFFVGTARGLGMSYSNRAAEPWIRKIAKSGFDVGLHGIAFEDEEGIQREFELFKKMSGMASFGVRMHYLRFSEITPHILDRTGYIFDSSSETLENPYKVGKLVEFPVSLMDVRVIFPYNRLRPEGFSEIRANTERIIEEAIQRGVKYFTLIFHDRYYSDCFRLAKRWYEWIIPYFRERGMTFISFRNAVSELNRD